MQQSNYHVHTTFSDGRTTIEEYVQYAISLHFTTIGFSDHVPLSFKVRAHMLPENFDKYIAEVERVRCLYGDKIKILAGLEVDYLSHGKTLYDRTKLDYIIGSIHFMGMLDEHIAWDIDGGVEKFNYGFSLLYNNDVEKFVTDYFSRIRKMVTEMQPDMIGHIDKIKIQPVVNEQASYYQNAVLETLDLIAETKTVIEINTKGLYAHQLDFYPSAWILLACKERKIPICITTDAHQKNALTSGYQQAEKLLTRLNIEPCLLM